MPALVVRLTTLLLLLTQPLIAQQWMDGQRVGLVRRAAEARARRDADTVLAGWQASAHGIVRFTAEVDHGSGPIERVIRADELRVEVYGQAPNRSKQVIVAWRDTTFQPTSIVYHRDHLGIVANDFGATIRLGEGEEVRDVPHPLSASGLGWYQFRMGDTLTVAAPSGTMRVVALEVRPVDPDQPGMVGTMLLDIDRAALVRLQFTFTGSAYRDPTVASITVQLENALHEGIRWLPWRQSIAIRRAAPIVVLPLATVIRAEWSIDNYQLGVRHSAARFSGLAIDGLRRPSRDGGWDTPWTIAPDSLPASGAALSMVESRAASMVRRELLEGLPRLRLLADGGLSRLIQVNRVQGVRLGAGVRWQAPLGLTLDLSGGVGTADGRATGTFSMSRPVGSLRVVAMAARELRNVHEQPRRSGVANSLATLFDGSDAGDWYLSERLEVALRREVAPVTTIELSLRREQTTSVTSEFTALGGQRLVNPALGHGTIHVVRAALGTRNTDGRGWLFEVERGVGGRTAEWWRGTAQGAGLLPAGLAWRLMAGIGSPELPNHRGFAAGGVGSLPGTVPRAIGGRQLLQGELARPFDVALPSPLGRRLGGHALASRLAPFVAGGVAWGSLSGVPWPATGEVVPVLGMRLDLWGPLLRVEAGWAPRTGGFSVAIDAHPDWWPLL